MWSSGETGLMSVEVAADFATTRDFITCHGYRSGSTPGRARRALAPQRRAAPRRRRQRTLVARPAVDERAARRLRPGQGRRQPRSTSAPGDAATGTQPAEAAPAAARCCGSTPRPAARSPGNPFGPSAQPHEARGLHVRAPQRPGPRPPRRRHDLVGRARQLPRRRGQPAAQAAATTAGTPCRARAATRRTTRAPTRP